MKVFTEKEIPIELWNNSILYVPQQLADLYKEILILHGVYKDALEDYPPGEKIYGGPSEKETILHFVARYLASSTRVQYLILSPKGEFTNIQIDTLSMLSDGRVNILNIPCGTGSDILSLLIMLSVLRHSRLVPSMPLNIRITAGDISIKALEIYRQFLEKAKPILAQQAIELNWDTFEWDATKENTTALVIDHLLDTNYRPNEYLALYSALSGTGNKLKQDFERTFQHIESRLDNKKRTVLWIEHKGGGGSFVQLIINKLKSLSWFKRAKEDCSTADFRWHHPFSKQIHSGSIYIERYSSP